MNYFNNNRMSIIEELIMHDITVSLISYVLNVSELKIWRYEKGIHKIPEKHKRKLKKFLETVKRSRNPW